MSKYKFMVAYKRANTNPITGESGVEGNWYGDSPCVTVEEAVARMEELSKQHPITAVFYEDAWLYGGEPKYIIEKTDERKDSRTC